MNLIQDFDLPELPPLGLHPDERLLRVHERPDGYHWIDVNGHQEFGPFRSLAEALADMDSPDEPAFENPDCIAGLDGLDLALEAAGFDDDGFETAAWAELN